MIFRKKKKQGSQPSRDDYEKLGKDIVALYDTINPHRRAVLRTAFLKGVAGGVGTVIGATVVVALLLWVLSLFNQLPLVGGFFESLQSTIDQQ